MSGKRTAMVHRCYCGPQPEHGTAVPHRHGGKRCRRAELDRAEAAAKRPQARFLLPQLRLPDFPALFGYYNQKEAP